jgi:hypothetical protein
MTSALNQPHRVRVGIIPAREHAARARLFGALEALHPVAFEPRAPGEHAGLDALIQIGAEATDAGAGNGLPTLVAVGGERPGGAALRLDLADSALLERPLRGARLHETAVPALPPVTVEGAAVLAALGGAPAWIAAGGRHVVGAAPDELGPDELLRERLLPGRALALLALTHFVRALTAARGWRPPPLRAAFVLDDPNLHWPTYGHLRYRELLAHAALHRYHLAVAMVPLDAWLVHPVAARLFREGSDRLSILVHGNDHDGGELGRVHSDADGVALASQALRRIARFERRSSVRVARVMAPPHERVTEPALRALGACGFEAVSTARPFPWVEASGPSWLIHPPGTDPLAAFTPAHTAPGGLPIVLRLDFGHPREELVLRAYLGQPLVVYGHHDDLAGGLDVLADAAADVNRLGDVSWTALGEIARAGAETRADGETLHVRPLARRITVDVPAGVRELRVVPGACVADDSVLRWGLRGRRPSSAPADVELATPIEGPATVELELVRPAAPVPDATRPRLWPIARRIATEGRDRLRAVI